MLGGIAIKNAADDIKVGTVGLWLPMRLYGDTDLYGDRNAVDLAENDDAADADDDTRVGRLAIVARWIRFGIGIGIDAPHPPIWFMVHEGRRRGDRRLCSRHFVPIFFPPFSESMTPTYGAQKRSDDGQFNSLGQSLSVNRCS